MATKKRTQTKKVPLSEQKFYAIINEEDLKDEDLYVTSLEEALKDAFIDESLIIEVKVIGKVKRETKFEKL